jgi:hypothetical protein
MELHELLTHLCRPDDHEPEVTGKDTTYFEIELLSMLEDMPVKFHTLGRKDLELLSVYVDEGVINIDLGEEGE